MIANDQLHGNRASCHWRPARDYAMLFLAEGAVLVALGVLAIMVPSMAASRLAVALGWLFLGSGVLGMATTIWARHAPGFWWSLVSAVLAILVGIVLVTSETHELYGGLLGWPFETAGPLRMILLLFFLIEGIATIMFAIEHRRQLSGRWAWMFGSGVADIGLACIVIFDLPGTSAWTMGLLVGINMIAGGLALIAMAMHARGRHAISR
jgi:uncharacterized membrane protein HdeD (DUF308 family)